jgi:hypothetical protein
MTAKEKAIELLEKCYSKYNNVRKDKLYSQEQKRMALICIDEILYVLDGNESHWIYQRLSYWEDVKQEIKKL